MSDMNKTINKVCYILHYRTKGKQENFNRITSSESVPTPFRYSMLNF